MPYLPSGLRVEPPRLSAVFQPKIIRSSVTKTRVAQPSVQANPSKWGLHLGATRSDIRAVGPIPGVYSLVAAPAVVGDPALRREGDPTSLQ